MAHTHFTTLVLFRVLRDSLHLFFLLEGVALQEMIFGPLSLLAYLLSRQMSIHSLGCQVGRLCGQYLGAVDACAAKAKRALRWRVRHRHRSP